LPFSIITCKGIYHRCKGVAVVKDNWAIDRITSGLFLYISASFYNAQYATPKVKMTFFKKALKSSKLRDSEIS